jgi:hypothetical protein
MYQLTIFQPEIKPSHVINDGVTTIPLDSANADFQKFKADLAEGVELQDAEGNVMTAEQVAAFLKSITET